MDSIYYVLIIIGISFGLIVLYIILRGMKVIGSIPILSDVVDPILFGAMSVPYKAISTRAELTRDKKALQELYNEEQSYPTSKRVSIKSKVTYLGSGYQQITYVNGDPNDPDLWKSIRNEIIKTDDRGGRNNPDYMWDEEAIRIQARYLKQGKTDRIKLALVTAETRENETKLLKNAKDQGYDVALFDWSHDHFSFPTESGKIHISQTKPHKV